MIHSVGSRESKSLLLEIVLDGVQIQKKSKNKVGKHYSLALSSFLCQFYSIILVILPHKMAGWRSNIRQQDHGSCQEATNEQQGSQEKGGGRYYRAGQRSGIVLFVFFYNSFFLFFIFLSTLLQANRGIF